MASAIPLSSSKRAKDEQSVMGTNNSSIVSKRSVERLYYPEPHFFRYFVKKPQRRAPLINRGYWLRMHAIDVVVRQFLEESSPKTKVVLNLGCGYDPLAFQWLSKTKETARQAIFIDVDFPELIEKKSGIICSTPQLRELLINLATATPTSSGVYLKSDHYYAVGCDLADTTRLDGILAALVDLSECLVLCTAEVSITYMNVEAADSLIAWAARQRDFRFCLLEQYTPDGADHPFAQKMVQHFNNLQTPLKNIRSYPQLSHQSRRFSRAGWHSLDLKSLWHVFCDPNFVSREQRIALDDVEPFDEWEEFALFASHYFLLVAKHKSDCKPTPILPTKMMNLPTAWGVNGEYVVCTSQFSEPYSKRRFGSVIHYGRDRQQLGHVSGLSPQTRTATIEYYMLKNELPTDASGEPLKRFQGGRSNLPNNFEPRMCHATTNTSSNGAEWMIAGGRKSPDHPLRDCWLLRNESWQRVNDLPIPLYRHCQTQVLVGSNHTLTPAVLVYGGKTSQNIISSKWFLWRDTAGWVEVITEGVDPVPRFGAVMVSYDDTNGVLTGGMTRDSTICHDFWLWSLTFDDTSGWRIRLTEQYFSDRQSDSKALGYLYRFGASIERTYNSFLLIGGVADDVIPECYEMIEISPVIGTNGDSFSYLENNELWPIDQDEPKPFRVGQIMSKLFSPRNLFIGHSSVFRDGQVIVIGGGAVCFSFGSHWNVFPVSLAPLSYLNGILEEGGDKPLRKGLYMLHPLQTPEEQQTQVVKTSNDSSKLAGQLVSVAEGPFVVSAEVFLDALNDWQPRVCRSCELGPCVKEWQSLDIVKDRVGNDRAVVVHLSDETHMDFQRKNFAYVKKSFGNFIDDFARGCKQYLRSLASDDPTGRPANFAQDFPRLASDFHLLEEMHRATDRIHSSVLRISGFVDMWLHYDVMANVLCQIRGSKRLILFPPSDVSHLALSAGSSTSSIDCFNADFVNHPALAQTHPQHILLQPGDVLFIPPLWLHTASPSDGVSISVNVFFRSLGSGYAPGRDIYGNRDVQAYEKGRRDVEKITRSFEGLPSDMRSFYLNRLADELKENSAKFQ